MGRPSLASGGLLLGRITGTQASLHSPSIPRSHQSCKKCFKIPLNQNGSREPLSFHSFGFRDVLFQHLRRKERELFVHSSSSLPNPSGSPHIMAAHFLLDLSLLCSGDQPWAGCKRSSFLPESLTQGSGNDPDLPGFLGCVSASGLAKLLGFVQVVSLFPEVPL